MVAGGLLAGTRVLDFGWVWAAPLTAAYLADHGAEVIKLESRSRLEPNRLRVHDRDDGGDDEDLRGFPYFRIINRNKLSCTIDLKSDAGRQAVLELAARSDVAIENFKPGVMDRLGLGASHLLEVNPRLVVLSSSAGGSQGPYRDLKGYGASISSLGGVESLAGYEGEEPIGTLGCNISDPSAAGYGLLAVLAALEQRDETGLGSWIDLSQMEAVAAQLGEAFAELDLTGRTPRPRGNSHPVFAPHGIFPCRDGWISVAARDDAERARLDAATSGEPLAEWTARRTREQAAQELRGLPVAPVLDDDEVLAHPYYRERGTFVESEGDLVPLVPWHLSATPPTLRRPAPAIGADTRDVLRRVAGYDDARIDELEAAGVLA